MLQTYQVFYREMGVRHFNELLSPRLAVFKGFPKGSVYHHLTQDEDIFPDPTKPWFQGYSQRLPLELVYQSDVIEGKPRKISFTPSKFIAPFISKNHKVFRYIQNASQLPVDERVLLVLDYNPLKIVYQYLHNPILDYQKWESYQKTFWKNIGETAKKTSKQQFVIMDAFTQIPSYSILDLFGSKEGPVLARLFNTHDYRFILHLANFISSANRERSVFNLIPIDALNKVNIIFMLKDGRCSVLNLAYIYSWIQGEENVSDLKNTFQRNQKDVIRALLKYFMVLSSSIPEDVIEPTSENKVDSSEETDFEDEDEENIENQSPSLLVGFSDKTKPILSVKQADKIKLSTEVSKSLDDDLEVLEQKTRQDLIKRGISIDFDKIIDTTPPLKVYQHSEVKAEVLTSVPPNTALTNKLTEALNNGTLNPSSYKKALADSAKYTKMVDPYGSGQLVTEKVVIKPADLLLSKEGSTLVNSPLVQDKSMTNSSLQDYTRGYISKHHRNDILKAVGALQKGGVIVQKHEVTIEHDAMGSAENHNLELKPINGVSSSIWFKLPVVDEQGKFSVGNNRYFLRKQRVDEKNFTFLYN